MFTRSFKSLLLASVLLPAAFAARAADNVNTATTPVPFAPAAAQGDFVSALTNGTPYWQERFRYEDVAQDGLRDANAETLRSVLGYKTGSFKNFQADLGVINVANFGGHDYNDGSDGKTTYATILDPGATELYHANLAYTGLPQTTIIGGRQSISLDNERWVGAAQWRQFAQTFDAASIDNKSLKDLDLYYAYVFRLNGAGGPTVTNGVYDMNTHLFHIAYTGFQNVKLTAYSYLADINNGVSSVPGGIHDLSTATTGLRVEAKMPVGGGWNVTGTGEYARQTDYANNPNSFGLNYYLLEPGATFQNIAGKVGYESMGSNGTESVQSPLMTSHSMNGWADKFLITPANGLVDKYADISYRFKLPCRYLDESKIEGQVHRYDADQIDQHYGNEYDLDYTQKIAQHYAVGAQFADYQADKLYTDTRKFIVTLQMDY